MLDPDDARRDLDAVEQRRAALAARVRVPAWYATVYLIGLGLAFASPALAPDAAAVVAFLAAMLALSWADATVSRAAGFDVSLTRPGRFPSLRLPVLALWSALIVGSAGSWLAAAELSTAVAVTVGLAAAGLVAAARIGALAAVRADLRAGRAA